MGADRLAETVAAAPAVLPVPEAQLDLRLAVDGEGRTYLTRQRVGYPFHLGRSLHVPGDPAGMPTLYVQSCSGGIFEHDNLGWRIAADAGARAHVTTSASTIVHSMASGTAQHAIEIEAAAGAFIEYLPDPLILFPESRLATRVTVRAPADAMVLLWDAVVAHDPAGTGRPFDWLDSELRVEDPAGRLLARDRYHIEGATAMQHVPGITGDATCQAGFLLLVPEAVCTPLLGAVRAALPEGAYAGASTLPGNCGVWLRALAGDAGALRETLQAAWYAARGLLLGATPRPRRK